MVFILLLQVCVGLRFVSVIKGSAYFHICRRSKVLALLKTTINKWQTLGECQLSSSKLLSCFVSVAVASVPTSQNSIIKSYSVIFFTLYLVFALVINLSAKGLHISTGTPLHRIFALDQLHPVESCSLSFKIDVN